MPSKMDYITRLRLFSEHKIAEFDERCAELEEVEAYREVVAAVDSYIDYVMLDILMEKYGESEVPEFVMDLFYKYNFLNGTHLKEILFEKGVIDGRLKNEIEKFKRGRNQIIHNKHHIFALLPKEKELAGEEIENREKIAYEEYMKIKEAGKNILKRLTEIWQGITNPALDLEKIKKDWE